jgi:integrase
VSQDSLHHRRLFNERHEAQPPAAARRAQPARRGEDAVVENQVDSRPRRQHGEPLEQFQRIKTQVRRPVRPAVPQREPDRPPRTDVQLVEPYQTMVRLIAATGLRIGELLALRWCTLDLEGGSLPVRKSVFEGEFQPPKTLKAVRMIPLGRHDDDSSVTAGC